MQSLVGGGGGEAGRGPTGLTTGWGAGISPFTLGWTLGMLIGYSANLVRAGSHAETEERVGMEKESSGG